MTILNFLENLAGILKSMSQTLKMFSHNFLRRVSLFYYSSSVEMLNLTKVQTLFQILILLILYDTADFKMRSGLSFIHFDVLSLMSKLGMVYIWATDADVIILSESWLNKSISDKDWDKWLYCS